MNVHAILQRVLPPVERIGTGLLRLATTAEQALEVYTTGQRPRDVCGYWLRPCDVVSVHTLHLAFLSARITLRNGVTYDVRRRSPNGYDETEDELRRRVTTALGWEV